MATAEQVVLRARRVGTSNRFYENRFEAMVPDIKDLGRTIQAIAVQETRAQVALGNKPRTIVVDNSANKPLNLAERRVVVNFNDVTMLARAARDTLKRLVKNTRRLTGTGQQSYEIWSVKGPNSPGKREFKFALNVNQKQLEALANKLPVDGKIVIVGPMVDYGRKLFWNPKGRKGASRKITSRKRGLDAETGAIVRVSNKRNRNIHDRVIRSIRTSYPGIIFRGRWVQERVVGKRRDADRWPGVSIGLPQRGRLR